MIYQVLRYDTTLKLAAGIQASIPHNFDPDNPDETLPPHTVLLSSMAPLIPGYSYSFKPQDKFIGGDFVRGELDYHNPVALNEQ